MSGSNEFLNSRAGRWILPAGGLMMAGLGLSVFFIGRSDTAQKPGSQPARPLVSEKPVPVAGSNLQAAGLDALTEPIRSGQASALAVAYQKSMAMPNQPDVTPPALTTSELASWKRIIQAISEGLPKFEPAARKVAMQLTGRMFVLLGREQVAVNWSDLLEPIRETLVKGTKDADCEVRAAALDQISTVWSWVPGRDIFTAERNTLAGWKGGMLQVVQPHLKDAEIPARLAAMRCLAALPIDSAAAPALELLQDKEPFVKAEVIRFFALRPNMLPDEQLLKFLHEKDVAVVRAADLALASRGLTELQIRLGKTIVSPDPTTRASVITKLDENADVDAGVWLARLVEDSDASVRLKAVEAIARRKLSAELIRRLQIISEKDSSDAVRKSAEKVLRSKSTASFAGSLPPLPNELSSSTSANPALRAN